MIILNDEEGKEVIEAFSELERLAYMNMMQPRKARIMDMQELAHKMFVKLSEREKISPGIFKAIVCDAVDSSTVKLLPFLKGHVKPVPRPCELSGFDGVILAPAEEPGSLTFDLIHSVEGNSGK